jgi:DNA modification methylase
MSEYTLHHGDCLEVLPTLPAQSVDAVICDPPYGTTACKWDAVIPFAPMWAEIKRVLRPRGACVLFGSQPFTSALVMSNPGWFRYEWVWQKTVGSNPMNTRHQPFKKHENVLVFYRATPTYRPQMEPGTPYRDVARATNLRATVGRGMKKAIENEGWRVPSSVQLVPNGNNGNVHPTQKPVALMEYLIRTYTNEGETVLDNTMGSGTTGVACVNAGREFVGIEKDAGYFAIAEQRIAKAQADRAELLVA